MVLGLCQMLSPILAFTADEAWEFIPGRSPASVHESRWTPRSFERDDSERAGWETLFALRQSVLPELEKARQAKTIGKALEARVHLTLAQGQSLQNGEAESALRELLNVSQLTVTAGDGPAPVVQVEHAGGTKCERCWRWEFDVGRDPGHSTLCGRCIEAIAGGGRADG